MSIIDALALDDGTVLESDVCIVGAGAAGLTLAEALDELSRTICVIESGGVEPDEATQALHELENVGAPIRGRALCRAPAISAAAAISGRVAACASPRSTWRGAAGWRTAHGRSRRRSSRSIILGRAQS